MLDMHMCQSAIGFNHHDLKQHLVVFIVNRADYCQLMNAIGDLAQSYYVVKDRQQMSIY